MTTKEADTPERESSVISEIDQGKIKFGEGILLAVASAGAYLWAFGYQLGYTAAFTIPKALISISLSSILLAAVALFPLLLFSQPLFSLYNVIKRLLRSNKGFLAFVAVMGFVALGLIVVMGWENWRFWIAYLFTISVFVVMLLILPWLYTRQETIAYIFDILRQYLGNNTLLGLAILVCGYLILYFIGFGEALRQEQFLVTNTTPEMVVLRIYGDNVIAAPFDRVSKQTQNKFVVLKVGDTSGPAFTLEAIGPLRSPSFASTTPISHTPMVVAPTVASPIVVTATLVFPTVISSPTLTTSTPVSPTGVLP